MATRPVDLGGALVADLPRGRIENRDQQRLVAVPAEWLEQLVGHARAAADTVGAALGESLEAEARAVLDPASDLSPEDVAYALSVALASRGLGTVEFEQWGEALTLVWRDPPGSGDALADMFAAMAARLVGGVSGVEVAGAAVGRDGTSIRVLLAASEACDLARERMRHGDSFGEIVARLERRGDRS
ncbi:MAG: hypothetical protein WCJ30_04475 [Deltaproteobacteria bacterium]